MSAENKARFRNVVAAIVTAVGMGYVLWTLVRNWGQVQAAATTWDVAWIALHFVVVLTFFAAMPLVWRQTIAACGIEAPAAAVIISAYLPNLYKYIPGKIWTVASRVELLARYTPTSRSSSAAATSLAYVMELIGTGPCFLSIAWLMPNGQLRMAAVILAVAMCVVTLLPNVAAQPLVWVLRKYGHGMQKGTALRTLPFVYSCYVAYWMIYAVSGAALLRGLGVTNVREMAITGCAMVAAWLIGFVSLVTPGGVGVREGVMIAILGPVIGPARAALVSVVARLSWTFAEAVGAAVAIFVLRSAKRNISIAGSKGESASTARYSAIVPLDRE
jgi:uncharacterized membrane protein YbhN (UPF0104 family)